MMIMHLTQMAVKRKIFYMQRKTARFLLYVVGAIPVFFAVLLLPSYPMAAAICLFVWVAVLAARLAFYLRTKQL